MPSPFAHVTAGYLLYRFYGKKLPDRFARFWVIPFQLALLAGISLLPDLDTVPGILFGDMGGFHFNASHSLLAGFLTALVASGLLARMRKAAWGSWFWPILLAYYLHILLDLFTGGRGLMLFWPLQTRFTSPVKLFYGVQWGLGFFSIWHVWTLFTEILFFSAIFMVVKLFTVLKTRIVSLTNGR